MLNYLYEKNKGFNWDLGQPVVKYLKLFNCKVWNRSHSVDLVVCCGLPKSAFVTVLIKEKYKHPLCFCQVGLCPQYNHSKMLCG